MVPSSQVGVRKRHELMLSSSLCLVHSKRLPCMGNCFLLAMSVELPSQSVWWGLQYSRRLEAWVNFHPAAWARAAFLLLVQGLGKLLFTQLCSTLPASALFHLHVGMYVA